MPIWRLSCSRRSSRLSLSASSSDFPSPKARVAEEDLILARGFLQAAAVEIRSDHRTGETDRYKDQHDPEHVKGNLPPCIEAVVDLVGGR